MTGNERIMALNAGACWLEDEAIADATRWWYGVVTDDESIVMTQKAIDELGRQYDLALLVLEEIAEKHREER